jgi:hypothetical protein
VGKFADFEQVYEPLVLPINGKEYTIPAVKGIDGLRFNAALATPTKDTSDGAPEVFSDAEFTSMLLGDVYQQMIDDGVPEAAVKRAQLTALADFQVGRDAAEMMWATGGDPKALTQYVRDHAPNRAARRSKSTAAAAKTR